MKFIFSIFFILFPLYSFCQENKSTFPESWEGKWAGMLEVFKNTGKVQELPMQLHILPIDTASASSWTWTIIYGSGDDAVERLYELMVVDEKKGQYLIDEKNTIKLEGYLLGGQFYQWFEVEGSRLLTKTELMDDTLIWEIVVSGNEPVSTTGDALFKGEEVPPVKAFGVTTLQRAVLKRQQ